MRIPRLSPAAYRRVTVVAALLLAAIVVTGAAVRLTGSGLGCPEWPNCDPDSLAPRDPTDVHAMTEFVNRVVTGLVSLTVIVAVLGSLVRRPRRRDLVWLSLGLVGGVFGQAVLGGLVVKFGLKPQLVMAHFLLSLVLLADAIVLVHRAGSTGGRTRPIVDRETTWLGRLLLVAVSIVVFTGTIVTATGPHGGDQEAERFDLAIPDVARVHGISVAAFLVLTLVVLWRCNRRRAPEPVLRRLTALLLLTLAQGAVGYIQYFNDIPAALVLLHILGATAVWTASLWFVLGLRVPLTPPTPDAGRAPGEHGVDTLATA